MNLLTDKKRIRKRPKDWAIIKGFMTENTVVMNPFFASFCQFFSLFTKEGIIFFSFCLVILAE